VAIWETIKALFIDRWLDLRRPWSGRRRKRPPPT
jgi:hypothetical protein